MGKAVVVCAAENRAAQDCLNVAIEEGKKLVCGGAWVDDERHCCQEGGGRGRSEQNWRTAFGGSGTEPARAAGAVEIAHAPQTPPR